MAVPDFLPFPGTHYPSGAPGTDLSDVCAPPYDVIDAEQRADLLATDPHNSVRLILPDSYAGAAETFSAWRRDGVLVDDDAPTFWGYRMRYPGDDGTVAGVTTGVIGALRLDGPPGGILPHERTLPKAKTDRLELLRATRANFDPIWGLSLTPGLSSLLEPHEPPGAWADDGDGVRHELFPITEPSRVEHIAAAVAGSAVVLADGHHRYETGGTYLAERTADGSDDPGARWIMAFVVELAPEQLCVRAIHRLVTGVDASWRARLAASFEVRPLGPNEPAVVAELEAAMTRPGGLGLLDAQGAALLVPRPALEAAVAELPAPLPDIDSARFEHGIAPQLDDADVGYRNDARAVAAQVREGRVDAAVLLRPVTVDQIRVAADAGLRMPQKTTFFAPKPRTGMVFRRLDG